MRCVLHRAAEGDLSASAGRKPPPLMFEHQRIGRPRKSERRL